MITIIEVLKSLNVKNWTLRGDCSTESEFHDGFTQNGSKNPNDWSITWSEVSAKFTELENAEPMRLLREERNKKLSETDWTQNRDVTLTNDSDWQTYRQELRDLPSTASPNLDENGQLTNVTWPTKPT